MSNLIHSLGASLIALLYKILGKQDYNKYTINYSIVVTAGKV
jgi:hypothetical protein